MHPQPIRVAGPKPGTIRPRQETVEAANSSNCRGNGGCSMPRRPARRPTLSLPNIAPCCIPSNSSMARPDGSRSTPARSMREPRSRTLGGQASSTRASKGPAGCLHQVTATRSPRSLAVNEIEYTEYGWRFGGAASDASDLGHREWIKLPVLFDFCPHGAPLARPTTCSTSGPFCRGMFVVDRAGIIRFAERNQPRGHATSSCGPRHPAAQNSRKGISDKSFHGVGQSGYATIAARPQPTGRRCRALSLVISSTTEWETS
jgi:hypothetical protein